jgi:hypothetical protein
VRRRELEAWLAVHGAARIRHGSAHDVWLGPNGQTAPIPRHREIKTPTGRAICAQLGVERPPFR